MILIILPYAIGISVEIKERKKSRKELILIKEAYSDFLFIKFYFIYYNLLNPITSLDSK